MESKLLHGIPLFESLSESESQAVSSRLQIRQWTRNSILINEGEKSNCLFIILTGKVKIFLVDEHHTLATRHRRDYRVLRLRDSRRAISP